MKVTNMKILVKQHGNGEFGIYMSGQKEYFGKYRLNKEDAKNALESLMRNIAESRIKKMRKYFPQGYVDKDTGKIIKTSIRLEDNNF